MRLDRIVIEPRLRSAWEALDLGVVLARQWFWPLFVLWLLPALGLAVALGLILQDSLWVAGMLLWWLKPLLDRPLLFYASRALFGESPSIGGVLKTLPSIYRFDLLPWLLWRRLNVTRSFDLPVTLLERLAGKRRKQRLSVLHRQNTGAATWYTIACVHLELLLVFGTLGLISLLLPEEAGVDVFSAFFDEASSAHEWIYNLLSVLAMATVAPFYVLGGFALYISRRVELEGWDIEVRFRSLAERLTREGHPFAKESGRHPGSNAAVLKSVMLALTVGLMALSPDPLTPVLANETPDVVEVVDASSAQKLIDDVLAGPEFHQMQEVTRWRLKETSSVEGGNDQVPSWLIRLVELFEYLFSGSEASSDESRPLELGALLEFLIWLIVFGFVAYLVYAYRKSGVVRAPRGERKSSGSATRLFGLDVQPDSLPENVPAAVMALCRQGETRAAMSLLYRASLSRYMEKFGVVFLDSHTESECVQVIESHCDTPSSAYARDLTDLWQRLAYGHQLPDIEQVTELTRRWRRLFDDAR